MTQTLVKNACEPKQYPQLKGLEGITDVTLEEHFKLYQGYVTNLKTLMEKITTLIADGKISTPEYNELKRRLGFEGNGVVLHEYYFENMKPNGGSLAQGSKLYNTIVECFGSYENWEADFKGTGMMRGIGWASLCQCPCTGMLVNVWTTDHEYGNIAGMKTILVMDVWEHAYTLDFKPTGRKAYIEAFFKNINWDVAESRLS